MLLYFEGIYCNFYAESVNEKLLSKCLTNTINHLFRRDETILYIYEENIDMFLETIMHPRITASPNANVKGKSNYYSNYVIFTKNQISINHTMSFLINTDLWNKRYSSRGYFLIVVREPLDLQELVDILWNHDIINIILVVHKNNNLLKLYTVDLLSRPYKSKKSIQLNFNQDCTNNLNIRFNKTIKKLSAHNINLIKKFNMKESTMLKIILYTVKLIASALGTNVTFYNTSDKLSIFFNRSADIILDLVLHPTYKYDDILDVSDLIFQDQLVWIAPKNIKKYNTKLLFAIFQNTVWWLIFLIFLLMLLMWWVQAKQSKEKKFLDFFRNVLVALVFSFGSTTNALPISNKLRFLIILYVIFCVLILNTIQGNLINVLINPVYEQAISTIEEFANLDLPIIGSSSNKNILLQNSNKEVFTKIVNRFVKNKSFNATENILHVIRHKNSSTLAAQRLFFRLFYRDIQFLSVIDKNTGLLPIECFVCMRQGHYFFSTFNTLNTRLIEAGFHDKLLSDITAFHKIRRTYEFKATNISLKLSHLTIIFLWWAAGIAISTFVFITELIVYKYFN